MRPSPRHVLLLSCAAAVACRGADSYDAFNPYGDGADCAGCVDEPGGGDSQQGGDGSAGQNGGNSGNNSGGGAGNQDGTSSGDENGGSNGSDDDTDNGADESAGVIEHGSFELKRDFAGPCEAAASAVDVNLGHTAETAVRALYCQVFGSEPSQDVVSQWANALRTEEHVRRIDVARAFCQMANKPCAFTFSDPWQAQVTLETTCTFKTSRQLGAVLMFFSECPTGVNCDMLWANNHAFGMDKPHAVYGFQRGSTGFYHPGNAGFWRREFLDARWSGLSFLLLNTYGHDIQAAYNPLRRAVEALDSIGGGIGLALMDDTWIWGRGPKPPFDGVPDLWDHEGAAATLYHAKWKPFFEAIPEHYWYKYEGRPLIYFYNAGTLKPRHQAPYVLARMKQMFADDFGVEPFLAVDSAFFEDEAAMNAVANARFTWDTFRFGESVSYLSNVTFRHSMVRWDAWGRDHPGEIAPPNQLFHKGPELLEAFLETSKDAHIAVIATWNDLGEGTGIHRNYDYFHRGSWLAPNHFMNLIRASQCDASTSSSSPSSP